MIVIRLIVIFKIFPKKKYLLCKVVSKDNFEVQLPKAQLKLILIIKNYYLYK